MVKEQLCCFLFTNSSSGRDKYCVLCEFVHYYENIVESIRQGKFRNKVHGHYFEGLSWNRNRLQYSKGSVALWFGLLTNIASGDIPLDIPGHPWPIIG